MRTLRSSPAFIETVHTVSVAARVNTGCSVEAGALTSTRDLDDVEHCLDTRHVFKANRHLPPMSGAIDCKDAGVTGSRDRDPQLAEPVVAHAVGGR